MSIIQVTSKEEAERQFKTYLTNECSERAAKECWNLKPWSCYRLHDTAGHYKLTEVEDPGEDMLQPVTLKLAHGRDSTMPGVTVTGVLIPDLQECRCGNWDWPTHDQVEAARFKVRAMEAGRRN